MLLETFGSTPKELFEDEVEELQEAFDKLQKEVRDIMKDHRKTVEVDTPYDTFVTLLREALKAEGSGAPTVKKDSELVGLHEAMKERAIKKQKRKEEEFVDLIYDKDFSVSKVTWEEAEPRLSKHTAYKDLTPEKAKALFEDWLVKEKEHKAKKRKHSESESSGEEGEVKTDSDDDGDKKKSKKEKKDKKKKKDKKHKKE